MEKLSSELWGQLLCFLSDLFEQVSSVKISDDGVRSGQAAPAQSGQLSCTCPWPSIPRDRSAHPSPMLAKHFTAHASLRTDWPHHLRRWESGLWLIESYCWIPTLPCRQSRLILCGTWRYRQPARLTLRSEACLVALCTVTHAFPPATLLCLFGLVLLSKILPRRGKDVSG